MKILLDTNIILDIALQRKDFYENSSYIIEKIDQNKISAFLSATTITDLYYIIKKHKSDSVARSFLKDLIVLADVLGVEKSIITTAIDSNMKDFEDSVQATVAEFNSIDFILTRNIKDFKYSRNFS